MIFHMEYALEKEEAKLSLLELLLVSLSAMANLLLLSVPWCSGNIDLSSSIVTRACVCACGCKWADVGIGCGRASQTHRNGLDICIGLKNS